MNKSELMAVQAMIQVGLEGLFSEISDLLEHCTDAQIEEIIDKSGALLRESIRERDVRKTATPKEPTNGE